MIESVKLRAMGRLERLAVVMRVSTPTERAFAARFQHAWRCQDCTGGALPDDGWPGPGAPAVPSRADATRGIEAALESRHTDQRTAFGTGTRVQQPLVGRPADGGQLGLRRGCQRQQANDD